MKLAILDDYADVVRTLDCFRLLDGHDVLVLHEPMDEDTLALSDAFDLKLRPTTTATAAIASASRTWKKVICARTYSLLRRRRERLRQTAPQLELTSSL